MKQKIRGFRVEKNHPSKFEFSTVQWWNRWTFVQRGRRNGWTYVSALMSFYFTCTHALWYHVHHDSGIQQFQFHPKMPPSLPDYKCPCSYCSTLTGPGSFFCHPIFCYKLTFYGLEMLLFVLQLALQIQNNVNALLQVFTGHKNFYKSLLHICQ